MTPLDWLILVVILLSVVMAAAEGFVLELYSLGGAVLGFLLAAAEFDRLSPWFSQYMKTAALADIAAFLTIFFAVVLLGGIVGRIARWLTHGVGLRVVDHVLGGAFGLLRGLLIAAVLVMTVATFQPESKWMQQASLARYFLVGARGLSWLTPESLRRRFRHGVDVIRQIKTGEAPGSGGQQPPPGTTPKK